jgi:hypothetical protein
MGLGWGYIAIGAFRRLCRGCLHGFIIAVIAAGKLLFTANTCGFFFAGYIISICGIMTV